MSPLPRCACNCDEVGANSGHACAAGGANRPDFDRMGPSSSRLSTNLVAMASRAVQRAEARDRRPFRPS